MDSMMKRARDTHYLRPESNYVPMGVHIRQQWLNRQFWSSENSDEPYDEPYPPPIFSKANGQEVKKIEKIVKFKPGCQVFPLKQALVSHQSKQVHIIMPRVVYEERPEVKEIERLDQQALPLLFQVKKGQMKSGSKHARKQSNNSRKPSTQSMRRIGNGVKKENVSCRLNVNTSNAPQRKTTKANPLGSGRIKRSKFMTNLTPGRKFGGQEYTVPDESEHDGSRAGLSIQPRRRANKRVKRVRSNTTNETEKDQLTKVKQNSKTKRDESKCPKAKRGNAIVEEIKLSKQSPKNTLNPKRIKLAIINSNGPRQVCDTNKLALLTSSTTNPKKGAFNDQPVRTKSRKQQRPIIAKVDTPVPKKKPPRRQKQKLPRLCKNEDKKIQTAFADRPDVVYGLESMRSLVEVSRFRECVVESRKHLRRRSSSPFQCTSIYSRSCITPLSRECPEKISKSDRAVDLLHSGDNKHEHQDRIGVSPTSVLLEELQQKLSSVKTKDHITSSEVGFKNHQSHPSNCVYHGNTLPRTRQELGVTFIKKPLYHSYIFERLGILPSWNGAEKKPKENKKKKKVKKLKLKRRQPKTVMLTDR